MRGPLRLAAKVCLSLVVAAITLELASAGLCLLEGHHNPYSRHTRRQLADELDQIIAQTESWEEEGHAALALHPYLGFVYNPDLNARFMDRPVSPFGFHTDAPPLPGSSSPDDFVIAVIGGSMAAHLAIRGREAILGTLGQCPALAGRNVVITSLSQGGYKQPQQLITVAYFLSLGARFDLVVNLDGVNELVWFYRNARIIDIDPSYPYNWIWMTQQARTDPRNLRDMSTIMDTREARVRLARRLRNLGAQRWATGQLVWRRMAGSIRRRETAAALRLEQRTAQPERLGVTFQQRGAVYERFDGIDAALSGGARLWRRGSVLTRDLLAARGIPYLHILQPNQYFADTKPLTDREREKFASPTSIFHEPLSLGYPHLLRESERLEAENVDFVDLSRNYADHPQELYVDACCHVNAEGNRILGEAVARLICDRMTIGAGWDE